MLEHLLYFYLLNLNFIFAYVSQSTKQINMHTCIYSRNAWKQHACSNFLTSVMWHKPISSWDHRFNQISPLELCHLVRWSSPISSFHTHMTATEAVCIISPPRVGHVHSSDWKSPSSVSPQPQEDDAVNCPVTPPSRGKSWGRRSVGLDQRGWAATLRIARYRFLHQKSGITTSLS